MGIDYIRSKSGKPHKKRWDRSFDRFKRPTLFDVQLSAEQRLLTAQLSSDYSPEIGSACLMQASDTGDLVISQGYSQIARVKNPPADICQALISNNGIAQVTVERVGALGSTVELKL